MNVTVEATRINWEKAFPKAAKYSLLATSSAILQIGLLFRQIGFTSTPAAAARVSILTIGQQALLDALVCIAHLLLSAVLPQLFTAFASIAFFKLVTFIVVEMRYIVVINHGRDPQRLFAADANTMRQEFALLHLRFYAVLFGSIVAIYLFRRYFDVLVVILYSYWVPQIVSNVIRDVRQPYHPYFLYGMSVLRLFIPLYLYGCPDNVLAFINDERHKPNGTMCLILVAWTATQVGMLELQRKLGPRFMVPARFLPPKYNYGRPIPKAVKDNLLEDGGDIECVICYQAIDPSSSVMSDTSHMITPCDHVFHKTCLEQWMEQKLECPVCRATLPPHD